MSRFNISLGDAGEAKVRHLPANAGIEVCFELDYHGRI